MTPRWVVLVLAVLPVVGCSAFDAPTRASLAEQVASPQPADNDLGSRTYAAVDTMLGSIASPPRRVAVAEPDNARDLDHAGGFGNAVAGMVRSRLSQRGIVVSEVRLRREMRMRAQDGETMLSRQIDALGAAPTADAVVTGTYVPGNQLIYVTLELVGRADGAILAAADFSVPRFPDLDATLR